MRLAYRLFLVLLVGLLPLLGMEAYNAYALHQARRTEVDQEAIRQARLTASELQRLVEGIRGILVTVSQAPLVQRREVSDCNAFLGQLLPQMQYLTSIAVADTSGIVWCSTSLPKYTVSLADRPYFAAALAAREVVVGDYIIGKVNKVPQLPLARAVYDPSGRAIGVAVATLDLGWLSKHLEQRGYAKGGSVTIADSQGTILARQPNPEKFVGTQIPDQFKYLLQMPEAGALEVLSQDGTRRILGYVPLHQSPAVGLYVSTGLSTEASFASLNRAGWRQISVTMASILLSLVGAFVAGRYFVSKPVETILSAAQRWQAGDATARTHLKAGEGEFGQIGYEIDRTLGELSAREETIRVLMRELSHRAKNQITLILAMARQIGKQARSVPEYQQALSQRLTALAASQDLLQETDTGVVTIEKVLATHLKVFSLGDDTRIMATGPAVEVAPETGRLLGMAFHELLTNAEKYGALSVETGKVEINWTVMQDDCLACRLVWQENQGPAVQPPQTTGFGRLLIEKIIPAQIGGTTKLTFAPDGVIWSLEFLLNAEADASTDTKAQVQN